MFDSLKRIFEKYIGQLLIILTVAGLVLFGYSYWRDQNEARKYAHLIGTKEKYKQLTKYTAKLESDYKAQKDLAEAAKKQWAEIERTKDERIKLLSDATYLIGRHVEKQNGPDYYFETKKRTRNYLLNELRISGENSPPIGYILIKHDGRTYKRNYKFEVVAKNLQTIDESTGKVKVYTKAYLIMKEVSPLAKRLESYKDWKDKPYELDVVGGTALIDPTMPDLQKKFFWWAPHVALGVGLGAGSGGAFFKPSLDFSFSGYGKTKNDLDWKFISLGLDVDSKFKNPGIHFTPFSYRFWPSFLTNTYLGPAIGFDIKGINGQVLINVNL